MAPNSCYSISMRSRRAHKEGGTAQAMTIWIGVLASLTDGPFKAKVVQHTEVRS